MFSTIIISVIAFLIIVLFLVGILLYAKKKLMPSGIVKISINGGDKVLEVEPGNSLLSTLSDQNIFLPSACGGGGSCGMCRCNVDEGGGDILPTEVNFFTRKQQQEHFRLACQVKVKQDMAIRVPESALGVRKWECEVVSNNNVATFIKEFVVKLPVGETLNFKSGGYIQIDVPKYDEIKFADFDINPEFREDWDKMNMWGLVTKNPEPTYRAYSMANHPAEGNIIMLNIRIATPPWDRAAGAFAKLNPGICSSYIFSLKPGDKITISGPYGEFHVKDTPNEKMFIGGGAGMAPMRSHIFNLFQTEKTDKKVTFWYGARSAREVFYEDQFRDIEKNFPNFKFEIGLSEPKPEDNWKGYTGFIHNIIYENYLKNHEAPEDIEYYLCGPGPMTNAITKMLDELGVPAENIMYDNFG